MKILALSAHTDDAELGAGGFLARAVERGDNVAVIAFSTGNPQTGANISEFRAARDILGYSGQCYDYPTRKFHEYRQIILDDLILFRKSLKPDLILAPATTDVHQDHQVVTAEARRAFRTSSILGYELPWCNYEFRPTMYMALTAEQMEKKHAALACYESQQIRHYFDWRVVEGLARVRGMQVGVEFAEAFEVVRWVMK